MLEWVLCAQRCHQSSNKGSTAFNCHLKWGPPCKVEPLTCRIWVYLQVESSRIEWNCGTPSWCQRIGWCGGKKKTKPSLGIRSVLGKNSLDLLMFSLFAPRHHSNFTCSQAPFQLSLFSPSLCFVSTSHIRYGSLSRSALYCRLVSGHAPPAKVFRLVSSQCLPWIHTSLAGRCLGAWYVIKPQCLFVVLNRI